MDRFRTKTRHLLQDVQYVEAIRKNRRRYLYTPLTDTATDVRYILLHNSYIRVFNHIL